MSAYESERVLAEYLLFHYGTAAEIAAPPGAGDALEYPARCVRECLDTAKLPAQARALDLGCAVGRASFELARHCVEVVGIDFSQRFIAAAQTLRERGELAYARRDEGELTTPLIARAPADIDRQRVTFETGDAQALRSGLGAFEIVLLANLIDRLVEPRRCLGQLPALVAPGGQLIITSPYTWLEEFTPHEHWLGGREFDGQPRATREGLEGALGASFDFVGQKDLPFLIREHARKFQWSRAEATLWRRKIS